jgi:acyl-CoA dehydrogenase
MAYLFEGDEHASLRAQIRRFAEREIAPHAHAWDEANEFPRELYGKAAAVGLLGVGYPEALGGGGGDVSHALVAFEELVLSGKSVGVKVGLGTHGIALPPILALGSDAQKRRFVPPVLAGEKIAALAITEPDAGSDVAALQTRAVRDGDDYVVNGAKTFISSGCRADLVTVAVRTGGAGHAGISLLVIERGTPGFTVSQKLDKMGWWASDTAELSFADCRVPVANRIGDEGQGFAAIVQNFVSEAAVHRRPVRRRRRARLPRGRRLRKAAARLRQDAHRISGDAPQARRHGLAPGRGARAHRRGRHALPSRRAHALVGGDGQEQRDRHVQLRL